MAGDLKFFLILTLLSMAFHDEAVFSSGSKLLYVL